MNPTKPTLRNCPVCANQVATTANICPHCGHPIKRTEQAERVKRHLQNAADVSKSIGKKVGRIAWKLGLFLGILLLCAIVADLLHVFEGRFYPSYGRAYAYQQLWFHALSPLFVNFPIVYASRKLFSEKVGHFLAKLFVIFMVLAIVATGLQLIDAGQTDFILPCSALKCFWIWIMCIQIKVSKARPSSNGEANASLPMKSEESPTSIRDTETTVVVQNKEQHL